ncbi:ornithine cyclodeaminase family protein [Leisingera methylohalidivorans]|uniref:Ornithine cyclodeaminase n=1 Tax=Leisingera methylohalidivorans DSM 14336 TaxID=999552 RepID=V9VSV9_9RHOB|nr:ornithine cyclodeaminase family protein [Leisingera methylohalidivorans]AHD01118.1 ornithine cyclodeaminase [Leisingera methylohalidivorans DSM 14336]
MIPVIGPDAIRPHLSITGLIPAAERAFRAISDGSAQAPVYVLHPNDRADIHVKSAALPGCPIFTVKMAGWSQVLADRGAPASSGMIAVFDSETCRPLAILQDDHLISDYRTAAAGALVARLLVPAAARSALIVGTGTQARLQAEALLAVRAIKTLQIWGRDRAKAGALCQELSARLTGVAVQMAHDLPTAVARADVIVTATGAKDPVIQAGWIRPGQHITSVGSDDTAKCEIDPALLKDAEVFVDAKASALQYGAPARAIAAKLLVEDALTEIGSVLAGKIRSKGATTIACLSGLGVQDLTTVEAFRAELTSATLG